MESVRLGRGSGDFSRRCIPGLELNMPVEGSRKISICQGNDEHPESCAKPAKNEDDRLRTGTKCQARTRTNVPSTQKVRDARTKGSLRTKYSVLLVPGQTASRNDQLYTMTSHHGSHP